MNGSVIALSNWYERMDDFKPGLPTVPAPTQCHFGHECRPDRLTLIHCTQGSLFDPVDRDRWLCPQHAVEELRGHVGITRGGYLHGAE